MKEKKKKETHKKEIITNKNRHGEIYRERGIKVWRGRHRKMSCMKRSKGGVLVDVGNEKGSEKAVAEEGEAQQNAQRAARQYNPLTTV